MFYCRSMEKKRSFHWSGKEDAGMYKPEKRKEKEKKTLDMVKLVPSRRRKRRVQTRRG